jgi:hypothetical protein
MALSATTVSVRQHLNEAALTVVRLLKEAKQFSRAGEFQEQFIKEYALPRELFSN